MTRPESRVHLGRGTLPVVALGTYAAALLAWVALLVHDAIEHWLVGHEHAHAWTASEPGVVEAAALADGAVGVVHYLGMWALMVAAMMYPSAAGVFQWFADRRGGRGTTPAAAVAAFAGAYTAGWVALGLVPLAVQAVVPIAPLADRWGSLYLGVGLLAVGTVQLSPIKRRCLRECRAPSLVVDRRTPTSPSPARLGLDVFRHDLGSCGALMALMVVVGSMNLAWMALLTAVITLERLTVRGEVWAAGTGLLALLGGVVLVGAWWLPVPAA